MQLYHQNARSVLWSDNSNALDKWSDGKVQIIDDLGVQGRETIKETIMNALYHGSKSLPEA